MTCAASAYKADARKLETISQFICRELGLARCELAVSLVGSRTIQRLNGEYRGKDKPTDVLSFPQQEWPKPLKAKKAARTSAKPAHRVSGPPLSLGDVVISLPEAEKNAKAIGQPLDREVAFLLVHGILHLCGHDHMEPSEEKRMLKEQRELMRRLEPKTGPMWKRCVTKKKQAAARKGAT